MSYDLGLKDPKTDLYLLLDKPHQMMGGTYVLGGSPTAEFNITYNYAQYFEVVFKPVSSAHPMAREGKLCGIRSIYGMTGAVSLEPLVRAIHLLRGDPSDDYWEATEGNAKQALQHCWQLASLCPYGVWDGD